MSMSTGTEQFYDDFVEGLEAPAPEEAPMMPGDAAPAGSPPDDFHGELMLLMKKHGLDDIFYVAMSADGATRGRTWLVDVDPKVDGYRTRCGRLDFECRGLIQHFEGSTWPE